MTDVQVLDVTSPGSIHLVGFGAPVDVTWTNELPVRHEVLDDVVAMPLVDDGSRRYVGGLVHEGTVLADSERSKSNRIWRLRPPVRVPARAERLPGRTLFVGYYLPIFGHALLELLPRLWAIDPTAAADPHPYDTLLCYLSRPAREPTVRLPDHVQRLLAPIGVSGPVARVVDRPLRLDEVSIASSAFWLKRGYHPALRTIFDRIASAYEQRAGTDSPAPKRVYLSRSRLGPGKRRASNEPQIEALAERAGFTIVHPQEMSIEDQVRTMRAADAIAGCDGSALHLAAFARPGTRLLGLDSRVVENQFMIDELAELQAVHALVAPAILDDRSDTWVADLSKVEAALDLLR